MPPSADLQFAHLVDRLAAGAPATATLESWCQTLGPGGGPLIARRLAQTVADPAEAPHLDPTRGNGIIHRRVALCWGGVDLVLADNFYLPARLPPALAAELDQGERPFGAVIADLGPERRILAAAHRPAAGVVLMVHALLVDRGGRPLAEVREHFLDALMAPAGGPMPEVR